jgi:hypothetical protein
MKDRRLLSGLFSDASLSAIEAVADARTAAFSEMVMIAGLDHASNLRHSDLRNVDLSNSNLQGFDFTGADLTGATGINVNWDKTTIFNHADLTGSIFAAKVRLENLFTSNENANSLLKTVTRSDWADQIIWAGQNLISSGRYAVPITEALFYRAKDNFVKAELMRYLAPRLGAGTALLEMLLAAISDAGGGAAIITSSISLLHHYGMSGNTAVRQIVCSLIDSPIESIRRGAVQFIMRTNPTNVERSNIRFKAEAGDKLFGILFVTETARHLGDAYDLVTRDPVLNSTFPLHYEITPRTLELIARRWLRAELSGRNGENKLPLAQRRGDLKEFKIDEIRSRVKVVISMWGELARHGVVLRFDNVEFGDDNTLGELPEIRTKNEFASGV